MLIKIDSSILHSDKMKNMLLKGTYSQYPADVLATMVYIACKKAESTVCTADEISKFIGCDVQTVEEIIADMEEYKLLCKPKKIDARTLTVPPYLDEFWKAYPRKEGKSEAIKAWRKFTVPEQKAIIKALNWHLEQWEGRDKKYIPMAATYLNQRRFEDAPENHDDEIPIARGF